MRSCISLPISILLRGQIRLAIANSNKVIAIRSIIYKPRATCTIHAIHRVKAFANAANMTMRGAKIVYNFLSFFVSNMHDYLPREKYIALSQSKERFIEGISRNNQCRVNAVVISRFLRSIECVLYIGAIVAPQHWNEVHSISRTLLTMSLHSDAYTQRHKTQSRALTNFLYK
jgi:hypothetical protein